LSAASASLPAAALANIAWRTPVDDKLANADLPLRSPSLRLSLFHSERPVMRAEYARSDRADLLARWTREIDLLCAARARPHIVVLPDHALGALDYRDPSVLRQLSVAWRGEEIASFSALAARQNIHILLAGWFRDAPRAALSRTSMLITPSGDGRELATLDSDTPSTVLRTDVGNWVALNRPPDKALQKDLVAAGAEWLLAPASAGAPILDQPLLHVCHGRALGAPPPGCPDLFGAAPAFRSAVVTQHGRVLACSRGMQTQCVAVTVAIGALRAARLAP
jgi:hypothetical protein